MKLMAPKTESEEPTHEAGSYMHVIDTYMYQVQINKNLLLFHRLNQERSALSPYLPLHHALLTQVCIHINTT